MIIDRASPTIRSIRREALAADAAVEKLGLDLDRLGSQQRLSKVQNASRTVKAFGRDAEGAGDRASKSFRNLHNEMDRGESRWRRLRTGIRGVMSDLWTLAKPAGMILGLGTALGVAAQGIGALAGGVVGLIPRLADLSGALAPVGVGMVGLGASLGTVALGFGGISAAVQGTKGAMALLTPEAARLAAQLRNLRPLLRDFRRSAGGGNNGLLAGASFAIRRLRSPQVSGTINNILRQTSTNLGGIERQATNRLTTPGALGDITQLAGTGNAVVRQGAEGILNLGDALRHVLVAAQPLTRWLSNTILLWTRHLDIVAKNGRESGRLARFFDRTRVSLTNMGHILANVWQTFRNLLRDARPLGDDLWKAAERTTAGWAKVTSSIDSRTGLTRQFMQMGHAIKSIFDLVGSLGQAIFRMGSSPQLGRTVDNLRGLVPALERILTTMANTFGPGMAATLTSFGNLVADLTAGSTGPFTLLLDVLDKTFRLLDGILKVAGPLKGVFTEAFSLAVMARFLSKLGLIEIGWRRVATAAGEAAVAESAAMGGAGGGFGIGLGRVFGGRGRAPGGPSLFTRLFRGTPGRIGPATAGEALAGQFGAVEGGIMGSGGTAALLSRGGLAGLGGTAARGALAVGTKFALPLLAIQGLFGALTTQRSGSFGHQAAQTAFGAGNGLLAGIPGHFFHGLDTPEQRAARAAGGIQSQVTTTLGNDAAMFRGTDRLTHQITDLQRIARTVQDRQTQASQQLLASINQEIAARRSLRAQLNAEATQRGQTRGSAILQGLNQVYAKQGPAAAHTAALGQLSRYMGPGVQNQKTRNVIEQGILRAFPNDPSVAAGIVSTEASAFRNVQVSNGGIYVGSQQERDILKNNASLPQNLNPTSRARIKSNMVASLVAYGLTPTQARADIDAWFARGMKGPLIPPGQMIRPGSHDVPIPAHRASQMTRNPATGALFPRHAAGGRVPGSGLRDTVPVGGLAAPGELIVNRHTERRVNAMLAGAGTSLGGLVDRETRRHSDVFATGGRVYPLRSKGKLIGTPGVGTHSFTAPPNNWESDNAVDLGIGSGTPVIAVAPGTIGSQIGALDSSDPRMAGLRLHLQTKGNEFYYAHLSRLAVRAGQRVQAGSLLGYSGVANGVAHLHFAEMNGNPESFLGLPTTSQPYKAGGASTAPTSGKRTGIQGRNAGALTALTRVGAATASLMGLTGGITTGGDGGGAAGGASTAPAAGGAGTGPHGTVPAGGTQALGRQMMAGRWPASEWGALQTLWKNESGWSPTVRNSSSNAQGIPQFLPMAGRPTPAGFPDNPPVSARAQIAWGMNYIAGRYGTPSNALSKWEGRSPHWYAKGGRVPRWGGWKAGGVDGVYSTPTMIGVGESGAERVKVTPAGGGGGGAVIHATFYITGGEAGQVQREVEAALQTFAQHLENHPVDGAD